MCKFRRFFCPTNAFLGYFNHPTKKVHQIVARPNDIKYFCAELFSYCLTKIKNSYEKVIIGNCICNGSYGR